MDKVTTFDFSHYMMLHAVATPTLGTSVLDFVSIKQFRSDFFIYI